MTLVEIMFAIALSSIAVVTLVVLFSFIFSSALNGKSQAKATSIAQRYMERLKADRTYYDRTAALTRGLRERTGVRGSPAARSGIERLHRGDIGAQNRAEGGARSWFRVPL